MNKELQYTTWVIDDNNDWIFTLLTQYLYPICFLSCCFDLTMSTFLSFQLLLLNLIGRDPTYFPLSSLIALVKSAGSLKLTKPYLESLDVICKITRKSWIILWNRYFKLYTLWWEFSRTCYENLFDRSLSKALNYQNISKKLAENYCNNPFTL